MRRVALAACLPLLLAACTGGRSTASEVSSPTTSERGGVLTLLGTEGVTTWDPQRIADPAVAALAGRLVARTLTAYVPGEATAGTSSGPGRLVGDLATDTGRPSEDRRTWTFTLREGLTWQDGAALTCQDVRHGIARSFATTAVTGGATDARTVLAIPALLDGRSTYAGPWATGPEAEAGAAAFDAAVECSGRTVTFHLRHPVADFDEMVSQLAFAPVRAEAEKAGPVAAQALLPSSGPYRIEGVWDARTGGTFVRNTSWVDTTDEVRRALPHKVVVQTGLSAVEVQARILGDRADGVNAVSLAPAPLALQQHVMAVPVLRSRALVASTGFVDHLALNVTSPTMSQLPVRQALALATNRAGYALALGGVSSARAHVSVLPSVLPAAADVQAPPVADPGAARRLLTDAGVALPVPIRVVHRSGDGAGVGADKAMAALEATWREAGFAPVVTSVGDDYFTTVSAPAAAAEYDVFWSTWAPAWGSASTVLPALFDSSINLTPAGSGLDLGRWNDAAWNASLPSISAMPDRAAREKAWVAADLRLRTEAAYVGLAERYAVHLAGSGVRNLSAQPNGAGAVDLATIGVAQ